MSLEDIGQTSRSAAVLSVCHSLLCRRVNAELLNFWWRVVFLLVCCSYMWEGFHWSCCPQGLQPFQHCRCKQKLLTAVGVACVEINFCISWEQRRKLLGHLLKRITCHMPGWGVSLWELTEAGLNSFCWAGKSKWKLLNWTNLLVWWLCPEPSLCCESSHGSWGLATVHLGLNSAQCDGVPALQNAVTAWVETLWDAQSVWLSSLYSLPGCQQAPVQFFLPQVHNCGSDTLVVVASFSW